MAKANFKLIVDMNIDLPEGDTEVTATMENNMKHGYYIEDDKRVWYYMDKKVKNEAEWKRECRKVRDN